MVLAIPLILLAAMLFSYGGILPGHEQSKGFVSWLGTQIKDTVEAVPWIGKNVYALATWVAHYVGAFFLQFVTPVTGFIGSVANYVLFTAKAWAGWAGELYTNTRWMLEVEIPKLIKAIPGEATHLVKYVEKRVTVIEHDVIKIGKAQLPTIEKALIAALGATFPLLIPEFLYIKRHWKGLLKLLASAGAIGATLPGLIEGSLRKWVTKELDDLWKRIKANEKKLAAGALAGVVAAALARLGMAWLNCDPWKQNARNLCRINTKWLTQLLLGGLAVFGTLDLIAFAKYLQPLIADGAKTVSHFWRADLKKNTLDQAFGDGGGAAVRDPGFGSA